MKSKKHAPKLGKYFMHRKFKNAILIIDVFIIIVYLFTLLAINNADGIECLKNHSIQYELLVLLKEFLVVALSIVTTCVFSTWFIDVKEKNRIYADAVCNDFLASEEFYSTLSDENKDAILNNLEKEKYFNGSITKEEMYRSVLRKLNNLENNYYYSFCGYNVACKIEDTIITKTVKRTMHLKSFSRNDKINVKNFCLLGNTYKENDGIIPFELQSVTIDGKELDLSSGIIKEEKAVTSSQLKGCGYTNKTVYRLKKPLVLSPTDDTIIVLKYITRAKENDTTYACRVQYPCKKFSFNLTLDANTAKAYNLSSHAFGFIDDANNSQNGTSRQQINITFDDWIFSTDGIDVVFQKK